MQIRSVLLFFVGFSYVSSMTIYFEDLGRRFSQVFVERKQIFIENLKFSSFGVVTYTFLFFL